MNQSPLFYRTAIIVAVFFVSAFSVSAQQNAAFGPSYDVVLQVVVGSDEAQRAELPKELTSISRQLRSKFNFAGYRVANTFLGRVGENGNLEYKSVANILNKDAGGTPMFLDWSLARFSGGEVFHAEAFRFGARIPIRLSSTAEAPAVYESIGLSFNRIGLSANTPTLLGTLSLPQTAGTMFLIVTIQRAEL
jgi:hypothetical protein